MDVGMIFPVVEDTFLMTVSDDSLWSREKMHQGRYDNHLTGESLLFLDQGLRNKVFSDLLALFDFTQTTQLVTC